MTSPTESADPTAGMGLDGMGPDGMEPEGMEPEGMEPEGMEPDDKDWTWVLQKACPDCGFDAQTVSGRQVAAQLRANASRWPAVFERAAAYRRGGQQRGLKAAIHAPIGSCA